MLAIVAYLVIAPTGRYLLRAGWEEGKILWRRRPIPDLIADGATPAPLEANVADTDRSTCLTVSGTPGELRSTSVAGVPPLNGLIRSAPFQAPTGGTSWYPIVYRYAPNSVAVRKLDLLRFAVIF